MVGVGGGEGKDQGPEEGGGVPKWGPGPAGLNLVSACLPRLGGLNPVGGWEEGGVGGGEEGTSIAYCDAIV